MQRRDPAALGQLFETMGFQPIARHRHKNVTLYRQDHLLHLRDLQDRTGGFTAFIAWTFQPTEHRDGGRRADLVPVPAHPAVAR